MTENTVKVETDGFIRLVDSMGDDRRIVQSARVSYGDGTKTVREDRALIDYLMRHKHTSPFEKVRFEFHVRLPIFVARQWMRHRTGSFNEVSARYTEMPDTYWYAEKWRQQTSHNKQVTEGEVLDQDYVDIRYGNTLVNVHDTYNDLLEKGVGREQARAVLPTALYTEFYWTIDAHNLLHFINLRMHNHAQKEIQVYAHGLLDLITPIIPWTVSSWKKHVWNAVTFSEDEADIISSILDDETYARLEEVAKANLTKSRFREFSSKLGRLANEG